MKKLRMRLVNSGEELLDLQKVKEDSNDGEGEVMAVAVEQDYLIIDQDHIQSMMGADVDELVNNDQQITLGKIDQKINKARVYRGWIKRYARKHKRVRYTSKESTKLTRK